MNNNFKNICNIIRVCNIQQEGNNVSGANNEHYLHTREMICVYTDDGNFKKLYNYDEADGILLDLLKAGYISFDEYFGVIDRQIGKFNEGTEKYKLLNSDLYDYLVKLSNDDFKGVAYCREELGVYKEQLCILHGEEMHWGKQDLPAFRYCDNNLDNEMATIGKRVGDIEQFKKDIRPFIEELPLVQLIFAYYLSGAIRQILTRVSEGIGEYGLVTCITGGTGSGKTTVTVTLQNILFGNARQVSNNITSIGLYKLIRNSGICPVVRDDSSTDIQNSLSHIKEKVFDIYNISSGKCRITANNRKDVPLYAPFIESREDNWGIGDMLKPIRQVEGYKYRVLELICAQGDLTKDADSARKFGELSSKYSGMSIVFLDYLVDTYSERAIQDMYKEYVKKMDDLLKEKGLESRYANRTAVILTAARLCREAYEIKMNEEEIGRVMIDAISSFEKRLAASPDIWEMQLLYRRFIESDFEGRGVNDRFIADSIKNYNHKRHYVAFLEKKQDEFYIPVNLIGLFISEDKLLEPSFWGYGKDNLKLDVGIKKGERWKKILETCVELGILIVRAGGSGYSKTVNLGGVSTTCYHFRWSKLAKLFGDDSILDRTRFACDTEEEMMEEQELLSVF